MIYVVLALMVVILAVAMFAIVILKCIIDQMCSLIKLKEDDIKISNDELNIYKDRVATLEDAWEKDRLVPVRNNIIKVNVPFDKLDFVVLLSGVSMLLKSSANPDDCEVYIRIMKELQKLIDQVPENEPTNI